ncbi:MAG: quinoprotein dehydrogenase-associated SoxYZ-like carrier [Hyphomicrobiales bacterium]|nr:quinoprotein dehydrogenase-associated SoxYZ-like carrier [Hyphomicrobiales bacterium]MDE2115504.1 quinoprotein dehydrogenase-associated SoxYZ-like carrier [Hyphomicrobiales bacterium]
MTLRRRDLLNTLGYGIGTAWLGRMPALAAALESDPQDPAIWPSLVTGIFNDQTLEDGRGILELEAPYRAENAAIVPIGMKVHLASGDPRSLQKLWLIVDENPSPLVGEFNIGPHSGLRELRTRIRINAYSDVHAVAKLSDGKLYMVKAFVKAAGGCSAPMVEASASPAQIGKMQFRRLGGYTDLSPKRVEGVLMIRHPNNSGLQMDPISMLYIPAHFVQKIDIWQGKDLILSMEGGISISQDPHFRFDYNSNGAEDVHVRAVDTKGAVFEQSWKLGKPTI